VHPDRIVSVIDIGSNSIKSLVATRDGAGGVAALQSHALDARISAGIGGSRPQLSEAGMARGLAAIEELLRDAAPFKPGRTVLVATSAVRDAANGAEFRRRVQARTGHEIRILTGDAEARLIGRGLISDAELIGLSDFYVFDLGGGSLECLAFRARALEQSLSLRLGCVRLTEQCVDDPSAPLGAAGLIRIEEACRGALASSGFRFDLPAGAEAVFAGGTMTTARAILAARDGRAMADFPSRIAVGALRALRDEVAALSLEQRRQVPGLPPARADVFPAALTTVLAIADCGGFAAFHHSLRNLRYGLADEALPR